MSRVKRSNLALSENCVFLESVYCRGTGISLRILPGRFSQGVTFVGTVPATLSSNLKTVIISFWADAIA